MAKYSNMYAGDPNKPQNKNKFKNKRGTLGPGSFDKGPGKVSHMGPGSMGPPPKQGFSDNQNMLPPRPGVPEAGGGMMQRPMPALPPREIEKRLKNLEVKPVASTSLVKKVGDQYQYDKDIVYIAYASALSNLVTGKITNQSDATSFQFTPYNSSGVLLSFRGYFTNKSIYQSGDPTDYTWESTDNLTGYNSVERKFTTSIGLIETLGTPTKPGSGVTWTTINAGSSIPATAIWYAERFTLAGTTSNWNIIAVGAYISSGQLVDSAVIAAKIANSAITTAKILNDAIDNDKIAANAVNNDSIAANAITANEIQAGSIGVQQLAANSVTANAIAANSVTASEISAGTITASEIAANAITANAITAGTITANELASNSITSAKVSADAITVEKIDLNGTLAVTAASGAIRWNKADGDDTTNAGLFMGNNASGSPRFVIGSTNSFIYFNGATGVVSAVGVSESATVGNEETFYTSGTSIFTISPLLDEINIQLVGSGGGGNQAGTVDGGGAAPNGTATTIKVITNVGGTRATYTAAGGAGGDAAGVGGSFAAGEAGQSFSNPSGAHSSFAGTGGAGGAYNTFNNGGNGGTGAGGGGQGQAGGGTAAHGGSGGSAASFFTLTLTTASSHFVSTDHLQITVAPSTSGKGGGGAGGGGRARIKGELA